MRTRRGRTLRTRAVHNVSAPKSRNISVCCSMNKYRIFKYLSQTRAYNTDSFINYILFLIEEMSILDILGAVFVMDNVPFHKCTIIKQTIESARHHVLYLLPYSPFLNLIENLFFKWKQNIRSLKSENNNYSIISKMPQL
ncbi:hypothetical protein CDIK_2045 [Cucumispora dikerogammari]|nr:hypothetical protein CDIK_2045 [Cucumispora dikerogammari]